MYLLLLGPGWYSLDCGCCSAGYMFWCMHFIYVVDEKHAPVSAELNLNAHPQ